MKTHAHHMPFGAELLPEGVRFRLWAPDCRSVSLCLEGPDAVSETPMQRSETGWYETVAAEAGPGTRYRFRVDGDLRVPDPASRFQPDDIHGASEVIDPAAYAWRQDAWRGRPWEETILYELHVGTFSPEGTYRGVMDRLDYLVDLGVTAIELMPLADFPGRRDWGYNGAYPYAPDASYGRPEDLKALIDAAHERGLMVFLDVVYNHFGPEGNYLHAYAKRFFDSEKHTPWGAAISFDKPDSAAVRDFYIHNALYWIGEYRFDGLRFDAVHAIEDSSETHILEEIADAVHETFGSDRHVHLVLENDNKSRYLARAADNTPLLYVGQWNDDFHNALHVTLTGESSGYYVDYIDDPLAHLGRCLAEGFTFQGAPIAYLDGEPRGEPSGHLPPLAFVNFLQNHDQTGNRALGDRITTLCSPGSREGGDRDHAAVAVSAHAVHGPGVGVRAAVSVLLRPRRRADRLGPRRPAARIRVVPGVQRSRGAAAHPRSHRRGDVPAKRAGLAEQLGRRPCRGARLPPRPDRASQGGDRAPARGNAGSRGNRRDMGEARPDGGVDAGRRIAAGDGGEHGAGSVGTAGPARRPAALRHRRIGPPSA